MVPCGCAWSPAASEAKATIERILEVIESNLRLSNGAIVVGAAIETVVLPRIHYIIADGLVPQTYLLFQLCFERHKSKP